MWDQKWNSMIVPSEAALAEPDRRLDEFANWIQSRNEPGLAGWAVEALAGSLGENVFVVPDDPLRRAVEMAGAMMLALAEAAARRPDQRVIIVRKVILPHAEELLAVASEWRDEAGRRDWTGRPWASPGRG